jgi:hypothetical protein
MDAVRPADHDLRRQGKKECVVPLPERLIEDVKALLDEARVLAQADREKGSGEDFLPGPFPGNS